MEKVAPQVIGYRRRIGSDTWHWKRDCHWWPRDVARDFDYCYLAKPKRPKGDLCNECRAKERNAK